MKKAFKIIAYILGGVIILITLLLIYVKTMLPSVGNPPDIKVELSSENIERGKYLANHVMVCMDCHSTRDWSLFSGPPVAGTEGKGGEMFDQKLGFPGKYVAKNITPFHLGEWTDGEIFRAITTGVSKDGSALFPIMPYHNYGQLDKKDIEAVIAYLRSLNPINNETEESSSDFPMNFIINTFPKKAELKQCPPKTDAVNYGKYLVTAAGCMDCHTKRDKGEPFAGGSEFKFPDGSVVASSNLTPDNKTGIGNWTKEQFINRFKIYADSSYKNPTVKPGEFQTMMPWTMYAGMNAEDIAAIYDYLHSLKPVENAVTKFTPLKE
ncbi:MAG: cytochrome C [Chlorobi bacterium OLB4]|jgi:Cytochrome c.|nr:MAG: cytochrome C [Chlorobi bacterium OLB4]OQY78524.1 MAG: cytochrome C [Ignavibacteriales bacterium UTCHB1]